MNIDRVIAYFTGYKPINVIEESPNFISNGKRGPFSGNWQIKLLFSKGDSLDKKYFTTS